METMGKLALGHNMSYATTQKMFYPVAGSHCISSQNEVEVAHAGCRAQEVEFKHQVSEIERDICNSSQRYALLSSAKTVAKEIRSTLKMKVDFLTYANKGLMIQNDILEQDVSDRDKLLEEPRAKAQVVRHDRDKILQVGVVFIMDKLIELPEFTSVVSQIRHAPFIVGEEFSRSGLKAEIDSGAYVPNSSDSQSSHTTNLNYALFSFATVDHASLLGPEHLDMAGMR